MTLISIISAHLCTSSLNFIQSLLPYHKLGSEKYEQIGIINPYQDKREMDKDVCNQLYQRFLDIYQLRKDA